MNEWEVDREFEDGEIVVSLRKRQGHTGRTQWSLMTGRKRPGEERLSPFVPVWVNHGAVDNFDEKLSPLLTEARAYIQSQTDAEPAPTFTPRSYDGPPSNGASNDRGQVKKKRRPPRRRDDYNGEGW